MTDARPEPLHTPGEVADMFTPDDIAEIRRRVTELRDSFAHIGQEAWIDQALRVLDAIEPYAQGGRNLIADT